jgi:hypothetical protein
MGHRQIVMEQGVQHTCIYELSNVGTEQNLIPERSLLNNKKY